MNVCSSLDARPRQGSRAVTTAIRHAQFHKFVWHSFSLGLMTVMKTLDRRIRTKVVPSTFRFPQLAIA
jgi:hypothetical protein